MIMCELRQCNLIIGWSELFSQCVSVVIQYWCVDCHSWVMKYSNRTVTNSMQKCKTLESARLWWYKLDWFLAFQNYLPTFMFYLVLYFYDINNTLGINACQFLLPNIGTSMAYFLSVLCFMVIKSVKTNFVPYVGHTSVLYEFDTL